MMREPREQGPGRRRRSGAIHALRVLLAAALGLAAALLISCGGSGKGLIPTANAGPLQQDFEAVSQAAQTANGDCSATETAIAKTEQDFDALPSSVDAGLRSTLSQGIANLRSRALALCTQPLATPTTGTTVRTHTLTTPTTTAPATTPTTTATTPTTPTTTTPPPASPGGGTAAPGEAPAGNGNGNGGGGEERAGGVGPGGSGPPGQEGR
jgi:hypothetical protein